MESGQIIHITETLTSSNIQSISLDMLWLELSKTYFILEFELNFGFISPEVEFDWNDRKRD